MTKSFFERLFSGPASYSDNRTAAQKKADDAYTRELARATKDNPNRNATGFANPLKVATGSSLKEAGYDMALRDAYNEQQRANVAARKGLEAIQVKLGGGTTRLALSRLIPSNQLFDLEEILEPYCR